MGFLGSWRAKGGFTSRRNKRRFQRADRRLAKRNRRALRRL